MKGTKPTMKPEPNPLQETPPPPAWMSVDAAAEWSRVTPVLLSRRILTEADLGSLENYCVAIGQVRQCQRRLAEQQEPFFTGENGTPRPDPALRVMHTAMTIARQLAAELGLTPVSRSRPSLVDSDDDKGGFDDLLDT
jgi:P27 family predicted phage terminase small subunit